MQVANISTFNFEKLSKNFSKFYEEVRAGKSCSVFGVQNSMRPAVVSNFGKKVIYLTADSVKANAVAEEFKIMGQKTLVFESPSDTFLYKKAQSNEISIKRTKVLFDVLNKDFDVIIAPISSLFSFLPNEKRFKSNILTLEMDEIIDPAELELKLAQAGYVREELIFGAGQFSRRGEVFDIFPSNHETPFRIDFFDTQIESIKVFDLATQKGTKLVSKLSICPCSDLMLSEEERQDLIIQVEKLRKKDSTDQAVLFNSGVDEILSRLEAKEQSHSLDCLSCFLPDFRSSIFDYLNCSKTDFVVIFDESKQIFDSILNFSNETNSRIKSLRSEGQLIGGKNPVLFSQEQVFDWFKSLQCIAFLKITNSNKFFNSEAVFDFKTSPISRYTHSLKDFILEFKAWQAKSFKVFVFASNKENASSLKSTMNAHGIEIDIKEKGTISDEHSSILTSGYSTGFLLQEEKVVVVGTYDIFAKKRASGKLAAGRDGAFLVPRVGDYVVHHYHGIGICEGVTTLTGSLGTQDYVVIRYRDDDKLYVPTSQMDILDRFSGAETPKRLSKIGGQDFSLVKEKVRQSVKKLAINLVELYAQREKIKGHAFSVDTDLQREFENAFPYTETEDQLISTDEIKKDMESQKVMDRLLCGDVGFGKTEVALRAAFKAIMDGKQVAFVAPTTILSEQHFNTARSRMYNFGVEIAVLNRFKSTKETSEILKGLETGNIDIVCGTHRVLSKDVEFKNLGLIVLDEEQKFGVEDKEKLKTKYPNVDVLTLSATPIPRTLSMSLSGIRDISVISTPPSERLPIQTYVTEYSPSLVKDAIMREISRGGQVFVLFNSVEHIYTFAEKLRMLVPDAKVAVAHGQMPAKSLEEVVFDFYNKRMDVLVCTTIIENGIDIENANTLIVVDADKLGLSQLYQIRGRVGRSSRMAYAYLTYDKSKILTEEAYKRLDAISEFCEFGSGFKLAMRDLEIRGGGNILGAEQSGHMQKIGYDMYTKLLSDAVKQLRGEKVEEHSDVLVKVALDAYVPEEYISTSEERMVAYKRISSVSSIEEFEKLKLELSASYGKVPEVVLNLISISLVRQLAGKLGAIEVESSGSEVHLIFDKAEKITGDPDLAETIFKFRKGCAIDLSSRPFVRFKQSQEIDENFELLKDFLLEMCKLKSKN